MKKNFSTKRETKFKSGENTIYRCVICNCVSRGELSDGDGDYYHHGYHEINYGSSNLPAFICHECQGHHLDVMSEWSMEDEANDS